MNKSSPCRPYLINGHYNVLLWAHDLGEHSDLALNILEDKLFNIDESLVLTLKDELEKEYRDEDETGNYLSEYVLGLSDNALAGELFYLGELDGCLSISDPALEMKYEASMHRNTSVIHME